MVTKKKFDCNLIEVVTKKKFDCNLIEVVIKAGLTVFFKHFILPVMYPVETKLIFNVFKAALNTCT